MDYLALLCFVVAAIVFAVGRFGHRAWADVPLGLLLLTIGFVAQFVHATGHLFRLN